MFQKTPISACYNRMERHRNKYASSCMLELHFSDGRQDEEELDIRISKAIAIKKSLYRSVVVRQELSKKSKALNVQNCLCRFSPTVSL